MDLRIFIDDVNGTDPVVAVRYHQRPCVAGVSAYEEHRGQRGISADLVDVLRDMRVSGMKRVEAAGSE